MAVTLCTNGHYYNSSKYTQCPSCSILDVRPKIQETAAASGAYSAGGATQPAAAPFIAGGGRAGGGSRGGDRGGTPGLTVSLDQIQTGIDPVVGWLVCIKGPNKGRDYRLRSDRNQIGRAPNMEVCIEGDATVSRENHCQIAYSRRSKVFKLVPGTGKTLVYLNGEDLFASEQLQPFDVIDLGQSTFLFVPLCGDQFDWVSADKPEEGAKSDG